MHRLQIRAKKYSGRFRKGASGNLSLPFLGGIVLPGAPADFRKVHRRNDQEMGQGDPGRQHQSELRPVVNSEFPWHSGSGRTKQADLTRTHAIDRAALVFGLPLN
jgi:hypothetical protein